jgi:hypothetical protein
MSEEYSVGYSEGYQAGWNAAMDAAPPAQPAPVQPIIKSYLEKDNSQLVKWSDYELNGMHHNKPAPVQKRPQNCGTGYCSCVECVMEPAPVQDNSNYRLDPPGLDVLYTTPPAAQRQWVDPNEKSQKQFLPHIGEPVLFCHDGVTYFGKHTGGSFTTGQGITTRNFNTWECQWMYPPSAKLKEKNNG